MSKLTQIEQAIAESDLVTLPPDLRIVDHPTDFLYHPNFGTAEYVWLNIVPKTPTYTTDGLNAILDTLIPRFPNADPGIMKFRMMNLDTTYLGLSDLWFKEQVGTVTRFTGSSVALNEDAGTDLQAEFDGNPRRERAENNQNPIYRIIRVIMYPDLNLANRYIPLHARSHAFEIPISDIPSP